MNNEGCVCAKSKDASMVRDWAMRREQILSSARLFCARDLHQYLPIFTVKKQPAAQERGASNFKKTAHAAFAMS